MLWFSITDSFYKAFMTFLSCVFNDGSKNINFELHPRSWMVVMVTFLCVDCALNRILDWSAHVDMISACAFYGSGNTLKCDNSRKLVRLKHPCITAPMENLAKISAPLRKRLRFYPHSKLNVWKLHSKTILTGFFSLRTIEFLSLLEFR